MIKVIDSSLILQENTVNQVISSSNHEIREITHKNDKEMMKQKKYFENSVLSLKYQIADQTKTIKYLKSENYNLDKMLKQKEAYIAELIEPESQDSSCQAMRAALKKISAYISESETEQIKQVNTLRDLSTIMNVAQEINKRPESRHNQSQTD